MTVIDSGRHSRTIAVLDLNSFHQTCIGGHHYALSSLRDRVRIAVDYVGAGYAGLAHILEIRPDIIKLDLSLTRGIDSDPARAALATALVSFANEIDCTLVAEGVETPQERRALERLNIGIGQGFSLCRPMPLLAAMHFLMQTCIDSKVSQIQGRSADANVDEQKVASTTDESSMSILDRILKAAKIER